MTSRTIAARRGGEEDVGKVYTDLRVRNADDVRRAARGELDPATIREVMLRNVLADSGASTLCLSAPLIDQLGLPLKEEVEVMTAAGRRLTRLFDDARVEVESLYAVVECLELPGGTPALLGVLRWNSWESSSALKESDSRSCRDAGRTRTSQSCSSVSAYNASFIPSWLFSKPRRS